jgi:outer membrane protein assembly factor BamB
MKIRCSCGTKFEFDVTPEMVREPVKFVCPNCGLDSSDYVNQLVREEFAEQIPDAPAEPVAAPRLKIAREEKKSEPPPETFVSKYCSKHPGVLATEKCATCGKPICPKCLEQFGFFCSPLCKNKAEQHGLNAPVYAGQKFEVERQFWRKAGSIFGSLFVVLVLALGVWIWYAWFGSVPHTYFSVRFDDNDRAYVGRVQIVGKDQIIFLHGGTLARYDLKTKKQIWSQELIAPEQIASIVKVENDERARANQAGDFPTIPPAGSQEREAKIMLQRNLSLYVSGENIWVARADKLTRYDWDSGKVLQEVNLPETFGEWVERDGELQIPGAQSVTHVSLTDGQIRKENFIASGATAIASAKNSGAENNSASGGLPLNGENNGKPLDPNKVAGQAQNLKLPARIALPALLANAAHEQQLEAALKDNPQRAQILNSILPAATGFELVADQNGFVQFSARLLEQKIVQRSAMRAPPKKSALDSGDVSTANESTAINEQLNEMQRNNGGDTITEDESRYHVIVRVPDANIADWAGDVVGSPQLFALPTVNVVAAGKTIIVLDKSNKKLWETTLTYPISAGENELGQKKSQFGDGPVVEHGDTLYVFDQAVLGAFDSQNGNARWRLPSVGVVGLFFDDQKNIYVNTTTGNPDDIKYSRQIDITKHTDDVLMKIDSATGKTLWSIKPGGFISYLSGKFIYTLQSYDPNPNDTEVLSDTLVDLQKPAFLTITRINPKNGREMWEHSEDRAPIDVQFNNNTIELVFKREVEVLKFLAF